MPIAPERTSTPPAGEEDRGLCRRWRPRREPAPDSAASLLDRVLAARGLEKADDIGRFLDPSLRGLHDPSLIPDLDRAAERIIAATRAGEPIVIYGDYDVDGATATAILHHTLRAIAPDADVRWYVPHRLEEGYGLNTDAIEELGRAGARLIVSVDCGVTAIDSAARARAAGIDLIITDHHNPPASNEDLPDAYAVVHPRRPDSGYPFGDLCGAGVAYKLAWRLATLHAGSERVTPELRTLLVELLALVALGSVADVVPLVGENRIIARHGLARLKHSPLNGLAELIEASGLAGERIDAEHVGFRLAPRLNACGRMGHARDTVELLTTARGERAAELARTLSSLNTKRRGVEQAILAQAIEMAEAAGMTRDDRRAIVLAHDGWHPGVVGIVCSRLVDRFHRPTILMRRDNGVCAGSGRSIAGFNLHGALAACADHLDTFGGHDMAAGLRLRSERLEAFADAFTARANGALTPEDLIATARYDCQATLAELSPASVRALEQLGPFGAGNPRVAVRLDAVQISEIKPFGKSGEHMGLIARAQDRAIRVVGWRWMERAGSLRPGTTADLLVHPRISTWNGSSRCEPELIDVRPR